MSQAPAPAFDPRQIPETVPDERLRPFVGPLTAEGESLLRNAPARTLQQKAEDIRGSLGEVPFAFDFGASLFKTVVADTGLGVARLLTTLAEAQRGIGPATTLQPILDDVRDRYLSGAENPWEGTFAEGAGEFQRFAFARAGSGSVGAYLGNIFGYALPSIGSATATKGTAAAAMSNRALALFGVTSAAQGIEHYRSESTARGEIPDPAVASMVGLGYGIAEVLTEKLGDRLPIGRLSSKAAATLAEKTLLHRDFAGAARFLTNTIGHATSEGAEEIAAGELQAIVDAAWGHEYGRDWNARLAEFGGGAIGATMTIGVVAARNGEIRHAMSQPPPLTAREQERRTAEAFTKYAETDAGKADPVLQAIARAGRAMDATEAHEALEKAKEIAGDTGQESLVEAARAELDARMADGRTGSTSTAPDSAVVASYVDELESRGVSADSVRLVPREDLDPKVRAIVEGAERLAGMRVVTVTDDPENPLPAWASRAHANTVVVSVGEDMDARAAAALVAHEMTHVLRRERPEVYAGLVADAAPEIVRHAYDYVRDLLGVGLVDEATLTASVADKLVEEGAARIVETLIGPSGALSVIAENQLGLLRSFADFLRRTKLAAGLGTIGERAVRKAVDRLKQAADNPASVTTGASDPGAGGSFASRKRKDISGQTFLFGELAKIADPVEQPKPAAPPKRRAAKANASAKLLADLAKLVQDTFARRDVELSNTRIDVAQLAAVALPGGLAAKFSAMAMDSDTRSELAAVVAGIYNAYASLRIESDQASREARATRILGALGEATGRAATRAEMAAELGLADRLRTIREAIRQLAKRLKEASAEDKATLAEQMRAAKAQLKLAVAEERTAWKARLEAARKASSAEKADIRSSMWAEWKAKKKAIREGFLRRLDELRQRFKVREGFLDGLRAHASDMLTEALPKEIQPRFLKRVHKLKTLKQWYRMADVAAAALQKHEHRQLVAEARKLLKGLRHAAVHPQEAARVVRALQDVNVHPDYPAALSKKRAEKLAEVADYIARNPGSEETMPRPLMSQVSRLGHVGLKDLDMHSLARVVDELDVVGQITDLRRDRRLSDRAKAVKLAAALISAEMVEHRRKPPRDEIGRERKRQGVAAHFLNLFRSDGLKPRTMAEVSFGEGGVGLKVFYELLDQQADRRLGDHHANLDALEAGLAGAGIEPGSVELATMSAALSDQINAASHVLGPIRSVRRVRPVLRSVQVAGGRHVRLTDAEVVTLLGWIDDPETRTLLLKGNEVRVSRSSESFSFDAAAMQALRANATPQARAVMRTMWDLYNGQIQAGMRKWSIARHNEDITQPNYWPRHRARGTVFTEPTFDRVSLENDGVTHERVASTLPLDLRDAFMVFQGHSWVTSSIIRLDEAVAFGRSVLSEASVQEADKRQPAGPVAYFGGLLDQITLEGRGLGGAQSHLWANGLVNTLIKNATRASLAWNPFVIALQPVSGIVAADELGTWPMVAAIPSMLDGSIDARIHTSSPYLRQRHMQPAIGLWSESVAAKGATLGFHAEDRWTLGTLTISDWLAVRSIFAAAERKVRSSSPKLDAAEVSRRAARIAEQAVKATQPVSDVMHQSGLARAARQNPLLRAALMFTSQLNANYNVVYRRASAVYRRPDDPAAWLAFLRALAVAVVLNSLAYRLLQVARKKLTGREVDVGTDVGGALVSDTLATLPFGNLPAMAFERSVLKEGYGRAGDPLLPAIANVAVAVADTMQLADRMATASASKNATPLPELFERVVIDWARVAGVPVSPYTLARDTIIGPRGEKRSKGTGKATIRKAP